MLRDSLTLLERNPDLAEQILRRAEELRGVLRRRIGLMGGCRFLDLLFEGGADTVLAAIRTAATMVAEGV